MTDMERWESEVRRLFVALSNRQRRCLFIKGVMTNQKKTIASLARRHLISRWYLAGAINGRYNWSKRVVGILHHELGLPLEIIDIFLEPNERLRDSTEEVI